MSLVRAAVALALLPLLSCGAPRSGEGEPPRPPPAAVAPAVAAPPDFTELSQGPCSHLLGVERAEARLAPGDARAALAFAAAVERVLDDPAERPAPADSLALVGEALGHVDLALARTPRGALQLQLATRRASLQARGGERDASFLVLQRLLADHPNLLTLDVLFRVASELGRALDIAAECERVRPELRREVEIFALYDRCLQMAHATSPEPLLSWVAPAELARYERDRAERAEREARLRERFDEELHELAPRLPDGGAPP
jgi:hypothetical protein